VHFNQVQNAFFEYILCIALVQNIDKISKEKGQIRLFPPLAVHSIFLLTRHVIYSERAGMDDAFVPGPAYRRDAKEYARFCRFHRVFMVDGLESWRQALRKRGLSEPEIGLKISAALHFIRSLGEPTSPSAESAAGSQQLPSSRD